MTIKLKVVPIFPSSVAAGSGITLVKTNGIWTIGFDFTGSVGSAMQAWDADLDSISALSGTGIAVRTADTLWAQRSLVAPAAGITITNPAGIAGDFTFALANDLAAVEGLAATGIAVRSAADTWVQRSIAGTANEITATNGDGVAANPTLSLPAALTFTGKTVTGGTFTGISVNAATNTITNLTTAMFAANVVDTDPTLAAASSTRVPAQSAIKSYVDNALTGLFWKPAVSLATTANITLSGEQTIDGTLTSASRVLVKNQSTASQNGIYVSAAGAWTRAADMDAAAEFPSATVFVEAGTVNGDTQWTCTNDAVTVGTTAVAFAQVSGAGTYSAGSGLTLTANQFSIGANQVTRAMQAQGSARSIVGVTGNATANVADIQGTASQFLGVNSAGTALAFQTMSGDATLSGPAITVTKINGVDQTTAWTTYTPSVTSQTGSGMTATVSGRYKQIGKTIIAQADVTVTAVGTGSGGLVVGLPFTAAAFQYAGTCREYNLSGAAGAALVLASANTMDLRMASGGTYIVLNYKIVATVTYEIP